MVRKLFSGSKPAALVLSLFAIVAVCTAAGVNIIGNHVNSATGYQVNGAAGSSGQGLCSDGTNYDTPCNVGPGTLYYQTVDSAGSAQTQRSALNFGSEFTLSDSGSPSQTTVHFQPLFTGTSGYQTLPSGLIIQWGSTGSIPNDTPTSVSFPLTFPNAVLSVTCSDIFAGGHSAIWSCYSWTTTGFTGRPDSNSATAQYVAIGY